MADHSKIEWTDATWNPTRGCAIKSPGCTNCYAMRQAIRHQFRKTPDGEVEAGPYFDLVRSTRAGPVWTGKVTTHPELLDWPLRRRKPMRIFVDSMSDLFYGDEDDRRQCEKQGVPFEPVPFKFIAAVFGVMARADWHIFQVLTKRPERALQFFDWLGALIGPSQERRPTDPLMGCIMQAGNHGVRFQPFNVSTDKPGPRWPLQNVQFGVSVEDQARADERIPLLLQTPAAVRWISAEPLIGAVNLQGISSTPACFNALLPGRYPKLDWVVAGGESGPGARPCSLNWIRSLIEQCRTAGVPIFVKQLGAHGTFAQRRLKNRKGGDPQEWPNDLRVREYPA
jgi:protein gp37